MTADHEISITLIDVFHVNHEADTVGQVILEMVQS